MNIVAADSLNREIAMCCADLSRPRWPLRLVILMIAGWLWSSAIHAEPPVAVGPGVAVPLEGERFRVEITAIEADWTIRFQTGDTPRSMPVWELAHWGAYTDSARGPQIIFADGGVLIAELIAITDDKLLAVHRRFGDVELPLSALCGVLMQPPLDPLARDRLYQRLLTSTGAADMAILENGDSLIGAVVAFEPATIENRTDVVRMSVEGRQLRLETPQLTALIFNPALREAALVRTRHVWMGWTDGSRFAVRELQRHGDAIRLQLSESIRLTVDASVWPQLTSLQPRGHGVVYLSDMEPIGYKHVPFLQLAWPLAIDRNTLGGRMRTRQHLFAKGLGMHSASRVAFDLDGRFRRFEAELAIDASTGGEGCVLCRVLWQDAAGQWQPAWSSPLIRGHDPRSLPVSIDVSQAQRLAVIVEFADRGDVGDAVNWLDARLIPKP